MNLARLPCRDETCLSSPAYLQPFKYSTRVLCPAVLRLFISKFSTSSLPRGVACLACPSAIGAEAHFSCEQHWEDGWGTEMRCRHCCCYQALFVCLSVCRLSKRLRNEAGGCNFSYPSEDRKPLAASARLCGRRTSSTCVTCSHKLRKQMGTGHTWRRVSRTLTFLNPDMRSNIELITGRACEQVNRG